LIDNPIQQFNDWWNVAKSDSPLKQKSAVCISTINADGFPNGRFVDLKSADESGFVFCTDVNSAKGNEIRTNPKVALTVWWDHVGFQVRVIGTAKALSKSEAEKYWGRRSREAQLTTLASNQSQQLNNKGHLIEKLNKLKHEFKDRDIPKPKEWSGYLIQPVSIEFLNFKENRLHIRELFEHKDGEWVKGLLQP